MNVRGTVPRPYRLGKRADTSAETRDRIVAAALAIYRDGGMRAATTRAVAAAADVAPGTVRNHFPAAVDLAQAAAEAVLREIQPPGVEIYAGLTSVSERVDRLAREVAAFFERSADWWEVEQGDPDLAAAWAANEAQYLEHFDAVLRAALDPSGEDPVATVILRTIVGPSFYFALRGHGLTSDEAVAIELSMVLPWLDQRLG
jgi:AcrR family transcriptional regulator